jgi:GNAT superfamily N-acetyltransferase
VPTIATPPSTALRRVFAFERDFARRQATSAVPVPGGLAVLNDDFPGSYEHNHLIIDEPADPADVLLAADEVLGTAGRPFRQLQVNLQFPTEEAELAFAHPVAKADYFHLMHLIMAHTGAAPDRPAVDGIRVAPVEFEDLRPVVLAATDLAMPDSTGERNERLVDRRPLRRRGADPRYGGRVEFLAVLGDGGAPRAWCDLYLEPGRPAGGIAQIEDVMTAARWRNRGYGRALVLDAVGRARRAGCDLVFLRADDDDWPQELYRRLGFAQIGIGHVFQRLPDRRWPSTP